MEKRIRPMNDNVYVAVDKSEDRKTAGGLYVPDSKQNSAYGDKVLSGRVLAVGPGGYGYQGSLYETEEEVSRAKLVYHGTDGVAVGEKVLFEALHGQPMHLGLEGVPESWDLPAGSELRVLRCSEILAVVD